MSDAESLTNGIIDYSLKCLNGPHKNRFAYINLTPEGEIIGADEDNTTLCIENAEMNPRHSQVMCRNGTYFVKDLGSKSGTWHRQGFFDGVIIEDKLEIKIFDELLLFEFGGSFCSNRRADQGPSCSHI